jgi:hypothetical protein
MYQQPANTPIRYTLLIGYQIVSDIDTQQSDWISEKGVTKIHQQDLIRGLLRYSDLHTIIHR